MLSELLEALEALTGCPADTIAPPDTPRCCAAHAYAAASFYGDDANILDIPRVQIDVYTQDPADELPEQVAALLQAWHLPYTIELLREYDEETNRLRSIFQAEVF